MRLTSRVSKIYVDWKTPEYTFISVTTCLNRHIKVNAYALCPIWLSYAYARLT